MTNDSDLLKFFRDAYDAEQTKSKTEAASVNLNLAKLLDKKLNSGSRIATNYDNLKEDQDRNELDGPVNARLVLALVQYLEAKSGT